MERRAERNCSDQKPKGVTPSNPLPGTNAELIEQIMKNHPGATREEILALAEFHGWDLSDPESNPYSSPSTKPNRRSTS